LTVGLHDNLKDFREDPSYRHENRRFLFLKGIP
jgi:hypothetical protein